MDMASPASASDGALYVSRAKPASPDSSPMPEVGPLSGSNEILEILRAFPSSPTGSLPAEMERPTGGHEVISVSSKKASDDDVYYVSPSLKKQVDALPEYEDRPWRTRQAVIGRGGCIMMH